MGTLHLPLMLVGLLLGKVDSFAQNPGRVIDQLQKLNQPQKCTVDSKMAYVCDSMSKFSCKPETHDDGTGKVYSDEDFTKKTTAVFEKVKSTYGDSIQKMLLDRNPRYDLVRDLAIRATRQEEAPDCSSDKKNLKNDCLKRVAFNLANIQTHMELMEYAPSRHSGIQSLNFDLNSLQSLTQNQAFVQAMESSQKRIQPFVIDEKISRKVEKDIFPKVKKIMVDRITSSVPDPEVRKKIIQKIQNISYDGYDCSYMGLKGESKTTVSGLLFDGAFYNSQKQTFRFCNGYLLKNRSEFSIAMVIAHELAHSIDPCNIQQPKGASPVQYSFQPGMRQRDFEKEFPFPGLISCLRSKESIGAVSLVENDLPTNWQPPFCDQDQISESFCDWMGSEVLADYTEKYHSGLSPEKKLIGYSNVFRTFCNGEPLDFDVHPHTSKRIDRLLMAHPKIRSQIGCGNSKDDLHYCKPGENFQGTRAVFQEQNVDVY